MEKKFLNWNLPKVSEKMIYKTSKMFNFKKDYCTETTEGTFLLHKDNEPFQLLDQPLVEKYKNKYSFMHIGLVQVGIKALTRERLNASVLLCLRDMRLLDFNDSLLSVIQSSLIAGPIFCNYFPNLMVSLQDPNILQVLTTNIKFENLEAKQTSFPYALIYRIHYKCMVNPVNPAAKNSSSVGRTTYNQTMKPKGIISRSTKWSAVQFPEEWKLPDETLPRAQQASMRQEVQIPEDLQVEIPPEKQERESLQMVVSHS